MGWTAFATVGAEAGWQESVDATGGTGEELLGLGCLTRRGGAGRFGMLFHGIFLWAYRDGLVRLV